jgi:hypothetical protein
MILVGWVSEGDDQRNWNTEKRRVERKRKRNTTTRRALRT